MRRNCLEWNIIVQAKEIYLFGAGIYARRFICMCIQEGVKVSGCLVTSTNGNPDEIYGVPVYAIDALEDRGVQRQDITLVFAVKTNHLEIISNMSEYSLDGFKNVIFLGNAIRQEILERDLVQCYNESQEQYNMLISERHHERDMYVVSNKKRKNCFRVFSYYDRNQLDILLYLCTEEHFKKEYGADNFIESVLSRDYAEIENHDAIVERFIMHSHLDQWVPNQTDKKEYIPLQVGAAYTDARKGELSDDTGETISERNSNYSECTGIYWVWKNTKGQDYVGIEQYRRRLIITDNQMNKVVADGIDLVVGLPQFVTTPVREFFVGKFVSEFDWDLMFKYIAEYDTDYEDYIKKYKEVWFYFSCNLSLFKREWFDRYCEFAFYVAFHIDEEYEKRGIIRNDRFMGYIFESLLSIFIMRHYKEMNIAYTDVRWIG